MEQYRLHQLKRLGNRAMLLIKQGGRRKPKSELEKEARQAREILFQATTVFPFTFFPDTITIDRVKVTITHRFFFGSAQVNGIQIEDILNVAATLGPLFGSIKIWSHVFRDRTFETRHLEVDYLTRHNALEAEQIIQGYIIAQHKNIDTSRTPKAQLLHSLRQLGQEKTADS